MSTETQAAQIDTDAAGTATQDAAATDAQSVEGVTDAGSETSTESETMDAQVGAPEQYEAFAVPEGFNVDEGFVADFSAIAKELNLTQAQAQQFVDFEIQRTTAYAEQQQQAWDNTRADWKQQISKDEELGGARYDDTMTRVAKARDAFGSEGLKAFMEESGLGDHPEFVRLLARVGDAISEDRLVSGEGSSASSRPFYKNSKMN